MKIIMKNYGNNITLNQFFRNCFALIAKIPTFIIEIHTEVLQPDQQNNKTDIGFIYQFFFFLIYVIYRFQYKVYYPHITNDLSSNENLLKQFWRHTQNYFFKKIQPQEINRLQCIKKIFHSYEKNPLICFQANIHFWNQVQNIFTLKYLNSIIESYQINKNAENWLKTLYILWQILEPNNLRNSKQLRIKYKKLLLCRQLFVDQYNSKKKMNNILKKESQILHILLEQETTSVSDKESDELTDIIEQLQEELIENQRQNQLLIDQLYSAVLDCNIRQQFQQTKLFLKKHLNKDVNFQRSLHLKQNLDCIAMIINNLEEKQMAQSISKTLSKSKNFYETTYQVCFETAINIQPQLISQQKLIKMNNYRQNTLLRFYKTGLKSRYSFICSNYYGFNEMYHKRLNLSTFRDKDLLNLIKKSQMNSISSSVMHSFNNFNMCHHCKYLYPDFLLVTCKFQSDRQAIPKCNSQNSQQPDFSDLITEDVQKARFSQRFMARRKNCLTGYSKINDEFVCRRQYCLSCLHQTYPHDGMFQKGICPFCQGICSCSRCIRNQHILKFKNLYAILGGDLSLVQNNHLDLFQQNNQIPIRKTRGRPKKVRKNNNTHILLHKVEKKMKNYDKIFDKNKKINQIKLSLQENYKLNKPKGYKKFQKKIKNGNKIIKERFYK